MRAVLWGVLLLSTAGHAQTLSLSVMEAQGLSDSVLRQLQRAAVEHLRSQLAVTVAEPAELKATKKGCTWVDVACQRGRLRGGALVAALWLNGTRERATLAATFYVDGQPVASPRETTVSVDAAETALRALLDASVPGWLKKGWGGLRLEAAPGTTLKIDGRLIAPKGDGVVAMPAGAHRVDVLFPDGNALLQRVEVAEARRTPIDLTAAPLEASAPSGNRFSLLRAISYATWMVGTATLLSAFIVAFVGRQTATGQSPCRPDSRGCVTIEEAQEQQRKAQGYASTSNILLGAGLSFAVAGLGLFTLDVLK